MARNSKGGFAGFYDDDGKQGGDIQYPAHGNWFGGPNFDEGLWGNLPPKLLDQLQQEDSDTAAQELRSGSAR